MAAANKLLSEADIAQMREIFCILDKEKNDYLAVEDLKVMLNILGISASIDDCKSMCLEYSDSIQQVRFEEIVKILEIYKGDLDKGKPLRLAFKLLNADESGYVKTADVMRVLRILGEDRAREDRVECLIRQTSLFHNDRINFVDFLSHMMQY
jgi:Ca2+-binding EF-hand superfamily protein